MKTVFILLLCLTLAFAGVIAYELVNLNLSVRFETARMVPCTDQQAQYDRWAGLLAADAVQGTVFDEKAMQPSDAMGFLVYTLHIKNSGLLPAEMVEVQISPEKGDVLAVSGDVSMGKDINEGRRIAPGQTETLQLILLTDRDSHAVRTLTITYYIWGHPFTVKKTYG